LIVKIKVNLPYRTGDREFNGFYNLDAHLVRWGRNNMNIKCIPGIRVLFNFGYVMARSGELDVSYTGV